MKIAIAALAIAAVIGAGPERPDRRVAITIDDLPVVSSDRDIGHWRNVTRGILRALDRHQVKAVGFVNEQKLEDGAGTPDSARVALLARWLDAGHELGNHTWSHPSLHRIAPADFIADITRGEPVTRDLMERRGRTLRWFRHPFLHTGRTLEIRHEVEGWLRQHGYTVAPVTMDNQEWVFSAAYDRARAAGDRAAMKRVGREYLRYMERMTEFWEGQSRAIVGREMPQVQLIHANALNADHLEPLLAWHARRGYRFITLDEALRDSAFAREDRFTGAGGISWLHRWALTLGMPGSTYRGEPVPDSAIVRMAGLD